VEAVDTLIKEYANAIQKNMLTTTTKSNYAEEVNALAALITARANYRMAFRVYGDKES